MELLFLAIAIGVIAFLFVFCRRPMYEVIMVAFILVVIISGNISHLGEYCLTVSRNYLLYTIMAFIALSVILEKTGVITKLVNIVIALVGRLPGGAGFVTLIASSMMGALSGTGPGNAAAVGVITIPTMKRCGFSAELAGSVEMAASALGPVIPPSGSVIAVYGLLIAAFPDCCTFSQFWVMMWGISLIFILQRIITMFLFVKTEHIKPMPKEEIPSLREALKDGWAALLMVVVIAAPFIFDAVCNAGIITARLGEEGAASFTAALLGVVPSVAILYVLLIRDGKDKDRLSFRNFAEKFKDEIPAIAPVSVMVFGGFGLSEVFNDIGVGTALEKLAMDMDLQPWFIIFVLPLILTFLGMFLETLSIMLIVSTPIIVACAALGMNPILMAGMLNIMIQAMGHMTPPFALTFNVSLGIAEADYMGMTKKALVWCICQYIVTVLVLAGIIPIPGTPAFVL